jgi:hypothetical protein
LGDERRVQMPTPFLQKRQNIMETFWAVQDRAAPDYDSKELATAGKIAASELTLLLKGAKRESAAELGLTWRYLGDAWFCASRRTDGHCIESSLAAYEQAEPLLEGRELDLAKLRFNHANALRQVTGNGQFGALQKAQQLYSSALLTFRRLQPDGVTVTEASIRDVQTALSAYEMLTWGQKDRDRIQQLREKLNATDRADDEAVRREISREIDGMKADDKTDEYRSRMETLLIYSTQEEKWSFENQLPELDKLSADIRTRKPTDRDEALTYLQERLAAALGEPNLSTTRAKTLKLLLAEARGLGTQSPQTAKGRAAFEGKVRDLVIRAKPLLTGRSRE